MLNSVHLLLGWLRHNLIPVPFHVETIRIDLFFIDEDLDLVKAGSQTGHFFMVNVVLRDAFRFLFNIAEGLFDPAVHAITNRSSPPVCRIVVLDAHVKRTEFIFIEFRVLCIFFP